MNKNELVASIKKTFTPFAFLCECEGTHPTCASVIAQPTIFAQYETLLRICAFIERNLDESPAIAKPTANPNRLQL